MQRTQVIADTQLDDTVAMEVMGDATRTKLKNYVQQAQKERDRKASAAIIK